MKKSIISLVLAALLGISLTLSGCCHMHRSQCGKPACCENQCCAKCCAQKADCPKPCCAQKADCPKPADSAKQPCCPKAPAGSPKVEEKK
jgi:hypothetical protein